MSEQRSQSPTSVSSDGETKSMLSRDSLLGAALDLANKLGRGNLIQERQYCDYFNHQIEFLTTKQVLHQKDLAKYHGFGLMRKGNFVFVGYFADGIPHGYGMALFENTTYVEGCWVNGELYGPARQIIGQRESFASTVHGQIEGLSVLLSNDITLAKFSEGEQIQTWTLTELGLMKKTVTTYSDGSTKAKATFQALGEPAEINPETNEFVNKVGCSIL